MWFYRSFSDLIQFQACFSTHFKFYFLFWLPNGSSQDLAFVEQWFNLPPIFSQSQHFLFQFTFGFDSKSIEPDWWWFKKLDWNPKTYKQHRTNYSEFEGKNYLEILNLILLLKNLSIIYLELKHSFKVLSLVFELFLLCSIQNSRLCNPIRFCCFMCQCSIIWNWNIFQFDYSLLSYFLSKCWTLSKK